jgi:phage shock protein E
MKKWMLENIWIIGGVLLGAIGGYAYYHFIGCTNGTCMISSKPVNSTLYFGLMGGLFMGIFKKKSNGQSKEP